MYLSQTASRARLKEAENARKNRAEIVKAVSLRQVTRRDLIKWGLITVGGLLVPKHGLSPFAKSAFADANIPTGAPPSPIQPGLEFTQAMPRLELLERKPVSSLVPYPTREANTALQPVPPELGGGMGPIEGRPPGPDWAHQRWAEFFEHPPMPPVAVEAWQKPAVPGTRFHPKMPAQSPDKLWTFNGTLPPKLVMGRYGEPILFRHHNRLPPDPAVNGGFGRHTITTHEHNGHHGAENDGYTGAFFFPGQFYDYHWPIILGGHDTINRYATDPRAGSPTNDGHSMNVPGDWQETMSTHWFHDHMFEFTAQNVYKGNAAMFNIYSALDRGNEGINDGVNLQLPSGTDKPWGNLEYDVNLMLADKAWDQDGQLFFDIFDFDGFLGDQMTVNLAYKPYFEVERRKYRFRILNASVSRFFKLSLSDHSPFWMIANDGNLMERPVYLRELDEQGIAERYDIVIDFSRYHEGDTVWMVNLCEHHDGKGPARDLTVAEALSGMSPDPCVGKFLEFRIGRNPVKPDLSLDLSTLPTLIPLPKIKTLDVPHRTFEFGRSGGGDSQPWTIKTDGGQGLAADRNRVSAAPKPDSAEIWHLINGGGGWDHPIHIHFEEGQILARDPGPVPPWEKLARKDVYRLRPGGRVTVYMQFREFAGMFMEHCHNTVHEDNSMLLRWEIGRGLVPLPSPIPTPKGVTFMDPEVLPTAYR